MRSRWFNTIVVLLWISMMSWLVMVKVWPTLQTGEPPNYRSIFQQAEVPPPVCWSILWDDRPVGWAASKVLRRDDGLTEVHSRVFFGQLPLADMAPALLGA